MRNKFAALILASSLSACLGVAYAAPDSGSKQLDDLMSQRIKSAQSIISKSTQLEAKIHQFHMLAEQQIAQANKLKGEAHVLRSMPAPIAGDVKLDAAQLRAAQTDYQSHIDEFKGHASAYQDHLKQFQGTLGECHANEAAYQALVNEHSLHLEQFHLTMPNIRPPHVCGAMNMTEDELRRAMNSMRVDANRVGMSESALQLEELRLRDSRNMSGTLDNKVGTAAVREQAEQNLNVEFGRLRTEYELLKTEKDIIAKARTPGGKGSDTKFTTTAVAGKIRHR